MSSSAVLAFEAALQRGLPDTPAMSPLSATGHFESLIKARKKAAAAPAPEALPDNPTGALGRGTGTKKSSFEFRHPHLVHEGNFKLLPVVTRGKVTHVPIHPSHAMYNHESMKDAEEYTVHNPLESLARIGHSQRKKANSAQMKGAENPNSKYHYAYLLEQMSRELHPMTSQNAAHRGKQARGVHPHVAVRNVTSGSFAQDNQYKQSKNNPRTLGEHLTRIHDRSTGQASRHATNFVHSVVRAEMVTRGLNRIFDVARSMGKNFHGETPADVLHAEVMKRPLLNYSGRREIQGFHPEHLNSKHNTLSTGDFDAAGKPQWKPNPFYGRKKGDPHPLAEHLGDAAAKLNNHQDMATHLHSVPFGNGNSAEFQDKELVAHYLPHEVDTKGILKTHARMRGMPVAG
ncbi:MAG: hypothetical protein RL328_1006 [Acidobacteriota bacterium]